MLSTDTPADRAGTAVGGTRVAVGGTRVAVGGTRVAVGGRGVAVGGTAVAVGGTGVAVGGTGVAIGVAVGGIRREGGNSGCQQTVRELDRESFQCNLITVTAYEDPDTLPRKSRRQLSYLLTIYTEPNFATRQPDLQLVRLVAWP